MAHTIQARLAFHAAALAAAIVLLATGVPASGQEPRAERLPSLPDVIPNARPTTTELPPAPRLQLGFPSELILPPPSLEARQREQRFVPTTINPELPLRLVVGRPKILQLAATPKRIYVPSDNIINTEIIDAQSGRELAVVGRTPGTATLILWFDDPESASGQTSIAYEVRVFADPLLARPVGDLQAELNDKFPNSRIELTEIADRLIVGGQVPDVNEMSQILNVLLGTRAMAQPGATNIENATSVSTALNFSGLAGQPETAAQRLAAERADAFANRQFDARALAAAGIINQLKVVGEQQVMLKVTVAEVDRTAARSIGLNFSIANDAGETVFSSLTGNLLGGAGGGGLGAGAGLGGGGNITAAIDSGQVNLAIEALRQLSLARTLAEPNLVAINGQPADFQSGGSFPIPIIGGGGGAATNLQGVSFVPFGVQLQFTPQIQDRDVIRLQMNAEVSSLDASIGTSIGGGAGGTAVSGLSTSNFSTTVQLRSGQTIAVAGLLQTSYAAQAERTPFFGDLPIIGPLAGINSATSSEQELVILVTPHLVAPVDASCELPLPGDDVHEPTDIEFYLANRLESRRSADNRTTVRTDHARQKAGRRHAAQQFLIGAVGPTDRHNASPVSVPHQAVPTATSTPPGEVIDAPPEGAGVLRSFFNNARQPQ